MNETRPYASLSGSLLARKGGAKPAMRPQPFTPAPMIDDDLGWNDMGEAEPEVPEHVPSSILGLTPAPKAPPAHEEPAPVHVQQRALAERFGNEEPVEPAAIEEPTLSAPVLSEPVVTALRAPRTEDRRKPVAEGKKAAFTLRLEPDRHMRLRLATALTGRSAQFLVTEALDKFLETLPEVGALARHLPARSGNSN